MSLEPPPHFNDTGRQVWRDTITQLLETGYHTRVDPHSLEAYVLAVLEVRQYTTILSQAHLINDGKPHPAVEQRRKATTIITNLAKQWHLNARLDPTPTSTTDPKRGRWCDKHNRYDCSASCKNGTPCHQPASIGIGRCRKHAGVRLSESPAHLLALEERKNPLAGKPIDIGPAEALLWRVQVLAGEVARLDALIGSLEADEITWGVTKETETAEGKTTVRESRVHIWVVIREQRERALHSTCEAALRAGVEERLVRVAEMQAQMMLKLIIAVLGDFGVRADDERIATVVPGRIAELMSA